MPLIDKALVGHQPETAALSAREAATTILVASVACDGAFTPAERLRLDTLLGSMRSWSSYLRY
jgi:hypothetical protein